MVHTRNMLKTNYGQTCVTSGYRSILKLRRVLLITHVPTAFKNNL